MTRRDNGIRRLTRRTMLAFVLAAGGAALTPLLAGSRDAGTGNLATRALQTTAWANDVPADLKRFPSLIRPSRYEGTDAGHYDYVNPEAPVGGQLNLVTQTRFDSFNPFVIRGTSAPGMGLMHDTLMEQSLQEPGVSYPMIALGLTHPDDYSSATYHLDPRARFSDGSPITAEDVVWSFTELKKNYPLYVRYFADVDRAVAVDDRTVRFEFGQKNNRELPHIMGDLYVLSKAWWTGEGRDGRPRDVSQPTLEQPVGSGPYRIKAFQPGSSITMERDPDYWAWDTFTRVGRYNFAELHYTYFGNSDAAWQAFQKYGYEDFRNENRPEKWANEYNFPAFRAGDVVKAEFTRQAGYPMQGWFFNTRKQKFKDPRVREAVAMAFDFETMNRTLFYDLYTRTDSYFGGSELQSKDLPRGRELAILEELRGKYPDAVPKAAFERPYTQASYADRRDRRKNLRSALMLLNEAGYTSQGGRLVGPGGEALAIEFLVSDPRFERRIAQYSENLRRLGIDVSTRSVDPAQYQSRMEAFDFDVATGVLSQSQSPGNEQRDYWSSEAAEREGSRNLAGIANPAIDDLIERIVFAPDRDELVAATNALDRILLHGHYAVPQFRNPKEWVAYWDKFDRPEKQPAYLGYDTNSWWIVPEKAAALAQKYGVR